MNHRNASIRTLIVDDDNAMCQLVCKILGRQFGDDLAITGTNDADMAMGLSHSGQFELCVTDLNMPSANGFKILKLLKKADPLTQVIMLTAHPEENAIKSAFSMGAADYMIKPVHAIELCSCIEFMIARIRRFRSEILRYETPAIREVHTAAPRLEAT
ncbi:MAG: response regulator [Planctomycetota bacterium]|nr:response regulator [Planctomycetota bacterium]